MVIRVKLLLNFKEKAPQGEESFDLQLSQGATIGQALDILSIPESAPKVIIVNGRVANPGRELMDGDELPVFPPVEGG